MQHEESLPSREEMERRLRAASVRGPQRASFQMAPPPVFRDYYSDIEDRNEVLAQEQLKKGNHPSQQRNRGESL